MLLAMTACPTCGSENPNGARFCNGCGARLGSTAAPSAREERKVVTVLFADLAGFTARAETLDPEDVRAFLLPYYDVLTSEIERHGGHVDRFLGDGVMALFGAPTAHEDDPERAVRAALRILERIPGLGLDLHVRLGVNTGPVLFAAGSGGERDDAVTGDAVNTAARLQALAPMDGVVVGEPTYRATSHLFAYEALPPALVKGKAEPVAVFRPTAPLARPPGVLRAETTPFVGRDLELSLLVGLFERARSTPSVELVTIVAEPGLGKSRLVRELARRVEVLPDPVTWRVGRCLPYGDGISLWALGEIVKSHAGILDTDDQATLAAKLEAVLVEPDPSMRTWMKERLAPLVGLESTTQPPVQEEAFTAWRRFLEQVAQGGPTVLVVEDLHWADDTLVAFLAHLADRAAGLPLLLVTTARPELEERHPAWLSRTRRSTVLSLAALPDRAMTTLVAASIPDASPELLASVLERAAGSPLYAEQLAAMLRDQDLPIAGGAMDEDAIPASIAALLAARIDALPPETKGILLDAAVVGRTFWSGAVAALAGLGRTDVEAHLAELVRRELVRPVLPSTMVGEAEYTFWHALLRDVAYGELTRRARLAKHRATAAWITTRAGAARGEDAEIIVAHLDRALELATATGTTGTVTELRESMVRYGRLAAERATATFAVEKAETMYAAAIAAARAIVELDDAEEHLVVLAELLAGDGALLARIGRFDEAVAACGDALTAMPLGRPVWRARVHMMCGDVEMDRRAFAAADERFAAGAALLGNEPPADPSEAPAWWAAWLDLKSRAVERAYWRGEPVLMQAVIEELEEPLVTHGTAAQQAQHYHDRADHLLLRDRFVPSDETLALMERALEANRRCGDRRALAFDRFWLGFTCLWRREEARSETELRAAVIEAGQIGDAMIELRSLAYLGLLLRRQHRTTEAAPVAERTTLLAGRLGQAVYRGYGLSTLAWLALQRGDLEAARRDAAVADDLFTHDGAVFPFRWLSLWPLLACDVEDGRMREAAGRLPPLLDATAQPMPGSLAHEVRAVLAAAARGAVGDGSDLRRALDRALRAARRHGYL